MIVGVICPFVLFVALKVLLNLKTLFEKIKTQALILLAD